MERNQKLSSSRAITLIALIISVIVMLILVAVSVSILVESDLIGATEKTADKYKTEYEKEQNMGQITIGDKTYESIKDYVTSSNIPWIYQTNANGEIEITGIDLTKFCGNPNDDGYSVDAKLGIQTLIVPSKIDGKNVVKFSLSNSKTTTNGWAKISDVKKLIFEEGIEEIAGKSEWPVDFIYLKNVEVPNTVTSIPAFAFAGVPEVNFPNGKNEALEIPTNKWYADKVLVNGKEATISFTIIDENDVEHEFEAKVGDSWISWVSEHEEEFFGVSSYSSYYGTAWNGTDTNQSTQIYWYNGSVGGVDFRTAGGKRPTWGDTITTHSYDIYVYG